MNESVKENDAINEILVHVKEQSPRLFYCVAGHLERILNTVCRSIEGFETERQFNMRGLPHCVAVRALETWSLAIELAGRKGSKYGMALLRPMMEELILLRFLEKLDEDEFDEFIYLEMETEKFRRCIAQSKFFKSMANRYVADRVTFDSNDELISKTEIAIKDLRSKKKKLFRKKKGLEKFNWNVKEMAAVAGLTDEYHFIYQATSSAVHANVFEMSRMIVRDKNSGRIAISTAINEDYNKSFSIIWGSWIVAQIIVWFDQRGMAKLSEADADTISVILALVVVPAVTQRRPGLIQERELEWGQRSPSD